MSPFDPHWYRLDNLADEWRRKNMRRVAWRALTLAAFIVVLSVPALWSLAGVLDAVGLDGLLMMVEINVVIGLTLLVAPLWRPIRAWFRRVGGLIDRRQALSLFLHWGWPH